jgi:hypothetical protein
MNKQHLLSIVLVLLAVLSCLVLAETEPTLTPEPGTGLEGVISVGPIHGGPARLGVPNSRPLANAAFLVKQGDRTITSFQTDEQGRFRISLASGHYAISMKDRKGGVGHYGPFEVDVAAGQIKKVQWNCDTGMR